MGELLSWPGHNRPASIDQQRAPAQRRLPLDKFKVDDCPPGRRLLPSRHAVELELDPLFQEGVGGSERCAPDRLPATPHQQRKIRTPRWNLFAAVAGAHNDGLAMAEDEFSAVRRRLPRGTRVR